MSQEFNCGRCGKTAIQGTMQSTGTLHFRPLGVPFLTFRTADISVRAGMCPQCGTIEFRGDLEKLQFILQTPKEQTTTHVATVAVLSER